MTTDTTIINSSRNTTKVVGRDLHLVCVFSGMHRIEGRPATIREELTLGRTVLPSLGLTRADSTMSRHHFRIHRKGAGLSIEDLGSSNGTYLNRQEVSGTAALEPGDVIRAGESLFLVVRQTPHSPVDQGENDFVTLNPMLRRILDRIGRVATTDISVLILGETGTGKDVLAQELHRLSRRSGRFVPVNCSAIPATLLEASLFGHEKGAFTGADRASVGMFRTAQGGTLFLDEIGEMSLDLQAKLLRGLDTRSVIPVGAAQEIPVDVRIVAATSWTREALESGRLREDLLGRLEDLVIQLPPLRERREDILLHAAREIGAELEVPFGTADVAEVLLCYPWPRNVRELIRTVRSALILQGGTPPLRWENLKDAVRHTGGIPTPIPDRGDDLSTPAQTEPQEPVSPTRETLEALMAECSGNVSEMARRLGKDRKQIYRWLERFDLKG